MNIENNSRFKKTQKSIDHTERLIQESKKIVTVTKRSTVAGINSSIDNYAKKNELVTMSGRAGRTWLLIGRKGRRKESLNVGQSQDIFEEIRKIIGKIVITKKGPYYRLFQKFDSFTFYEIDIDAYLKAYSPMNEDEMRDLAYEFAKEYFAEALVAHDTASAHWDFYGSGMDKRFLFHLDKEYEGYSFEGKRKKR